MISVLIVNYNTRELLERCLETLERQAQGTASADVAAAPEFEVLVIDNASSDGSEEMVRARFPSCHWIGLQDNLGFGRANNLAARKARGDSLLLLNSDAWLADGTLTALAQALDEDSRLAMAAPQLHYPDGRLQFTLVPETGVFGEAFQMLRNRFESAPLNHRLLPAIWRPVFGPGWLSAACVLVRKSAFDAVGGFDEQIFMYFEDVDLCRRLRQAGWTLRLLPEAAAFHIKGGSRRSDRSEIEYRRAQLYYYRKHRPAWENTYLRRRLGRKFSAIARPELRQALLDLLDEN